MKINIGLVSVLALALSGCETIKSYFPDKEKDYRFHNEIPPLIVPPEIQNQTFAPGPQLSEPKLTPEATTSSSEVVTMPVENPSVKAEALDSKAIDSTATESKTIQSKPVTAESSQAEFLDQGPDVEKLIAEKNFSADMDDSDKAKVTEVVALNETGKQPELRVNQNLSRTWRILSKALTRQAFEITERNADKHYYVVQYDPDAKPLVDASLWDDVIFLFGSENNNEQAYVISLTEKDQQTYIKVFAKVNQSCEDEKCAKLFSLLNDSIQKSLMD